VTAPWLTRHPRVRRGVFLAVTGVVLGLGSLGSTGAVAAQGEPTATTSTVVSIDGLGEVDNRGVLTRPDHGAGADRDVIGKQAGGVPILLALLGVLGVISLLAWRPWKRRPSTSR